MSMLSTAKGTGLVIGATALVLLTAIPAGTAEPFQIRTVTMNGTEGPAYYSRVSGGYRFLAMPASPEQPALLAATVAP